MIKSSKTQGSAFVALIIILSVAILGVLGYVVWNNFFAPKNEVITVDTPPVEVKYVTVKINDRNFRYPLNKNNEKVVIIPSKSTPALQVSYAPIRNYYANKDVGDDCKSYVAGLVNISTKKEIIDYSYLSRFLGKDTFENALADGTLVQVGDEDLYLHGPFKQNEACIDIYENKDLELQNILSDTKNIRLAWLKSLELTE